jgi:hypothetical protein
MPRVDSERKEEPAMTNEMLETVELGQAEALIELGMPILEEEIVNKFDAGAPPYVEFEG